MEPIRYQVEQPKVTAEVIDDEVIIINLDTGNYYTVRNVGAVVWNLIEQRAAVYDILNTLTESYSGVSRETVDSQVKPFIAELVAEGLIAPCKPDEAPAEAAIAMLSVSVPYEAPTLEKYSDMQALLLIDPIHDVDERGWPSFDASLDAASN